MAKSKILNDARVRNAKPKDKPYKLSDGGGLQLLVHTNGSKYWQFRIRGNGKDSTMQLGTYPDFSLTEARKRAEAARLQMGEGLNPVQQKRVEKTIKQADSLATFETVARQWMTLKERDLAPTSYRKIVQTFKANVFPRIGAIPFKQINALAIRETLQVMEKRGALELMWKCRAWIRELFDFALSERIIDSNPIPAKDLVLTKHKSESMPTFKTRQDVGKFLRNLAEYQGKEETRLLIWLQMMVAARQGEIRQARWQEFDLKAATWTLPMDRVKQRNHITESPVIALSRQAVAALEQLKTLTGYGELLFPSVNKQDKPTSDMTVTKAMRSLWTDYRVVPHGFRHLFSTHANESGKFRPDVIEAALGHKDKNAIRAVYNKATYFKERRELAQWWANELEAMRDGAQVLEIKPPQRR